MPERIDQLFWELDANDRPLLASLGRVEGATRGFGAFMRGPAGLIGVSAAIGAAFLLVGAKAARMAADLEGEFARISTLFDTSTESVAALQSEFLKLFASLPIKDVKDLSDGLFNLISAGVPASQAMRVLEVAARAAVGGVTSVETAVTGLTISMNAFGVSAEEAADAFFLANKLGVTTFEQISASIGLTAGLAAGLNIELDDLLANMVALTLGGLNTAQAFTSLRQVMANILKPTGEFAEKFPELSKEFDRTKLSADGLTGFLVDLAVAVEGNDDAVIAAFGSVEALNAVLTLMANKGERVTGIMKEFGFKVGLADEATDKMEGTANNLGQTLLNQFGAALTTLGQSLLPAYTAALQLAVDWMDIFLGRLGEIKLEGLTAEFGALAIVAKRTARIQGDPQDFLNKLIEVSGRLAPTRRQNFGVESALSIVLRELNQDIAKFDISRLTAIHDGILALFEADLVSATAQVPAEEALAILQDQLIKLGALTVQTGKAPPKKRAPPTSAEDTKARRDILDAARDVQAAATKTLTDEGKLAIERFARDMAEKIAGLPEQMRAEVQAAVDQAVALLESSLAALAVSEGVTDELGRIMLEAVGKGSDVGSQLIAIDELAARTREALAEAAEGSNDQARIEKDLVAIEEARLALTKQIGEVAKEAKEEFEGQAEAERKARTEAEKRIAAERAKNAAIASQVGAAIRGALDLANAFGAVSDETAKILNNMATLAGNLPGLANEISLIAKGAGSAAGLLGFALPVAGAAAQLVTGLFGESPEEKAGRELLRRNNEVIEKLTREIGNLGINISGTDFLGAQETVRGVLAPVGPGTRAERIAEVLRRIAAAMDEMRPIAAELGIELTGNIETWRQFLEALQATELAQFSDTIVGQLDALRREFALFDITDHIEQIKKLVEIVGGGAGSALGGILRGRDLSTAAGRAALEAELQALFRAIQAGTLTPAQLGGLTLEQFLDALGNIERLLDEIEGGVTQTAGVGIQRGISEVTGSRMAGLLTSGNVFLEEIAGWEAQVALNTERTAALLQRMITPMPKLTPPTFPIPFPALGSQASVTINITSPIEIHVGPGVDPEVAGRLAGEAFVERIDAELGQRARIRALQRGITTAEG